MNISHLAAAQPLNLGAQIRAKNRLYFAPMGLDLCSERGMPRPEFEQVYQSLMDGGCGFGFLGNATVDETSRYNGRGLKLTSMAHAEALRPIFQSALDRGFPLGLQLQHYGPQGMPVGDNAVIPSPSGIPSRASARYPHARTVAMTQEQIFSCIRQFSSAAQLAVAAGATLLQIQASNGYLISSFLSPRTNRRVDDWGGTPLKRAKLLLSIIQEIRKVTNGQATLTVRLGIDDGFGSDGQQVELLGDVACALKESGIAAITCSIGVSETFGKFFSDREQAINISRRGSRFLKRIAGLPTGFTGSIPSISVANEIIESGDADFVGFARAVLADNNLVKKELAGREDEVTRCLWDSNCFRDKRASPATRVYCCVNPAYKRPRKLQIYYKENPA